MNLDKRAAWAVIFLVFGLLDTGAVEAATLRTGESMSPGQKLYSDTGRYFATLQTDGNFIVYRDDGHVIWATYTHGRGVVRATMQTDGNFVLYDSNNHPVWSTGTRGAWHMFSVSEYGQAMVLTVQDWWQTRTGNPRLAQGNPLIFPYQFVFQPGQMHSTGGPHSVTFQTDGNLVVSRFGQPIWSSHTPRATQASVAYGLYISDGGITRFQAPARYKPVPSPGTALEFTLGYVALFPDGNLVAYRAVPVWTAAHDHIPLRERPKIPHCVGDPIKCGTNSIRRGWK